MSENIRSKAMSMVNDLYLLMKDGPDSDLLPMVNAIGCIISDRAWEESHNG